MASRAAFGALVDLDGRHDLLAARDTARTPASVEKLYTTSAALTLYGVDRHLTRARSATSASTRAAC